MDFKKKDSRTMALTGKVAFITGSANGLGKGYAHALLESGAKVFLNDIDEIAGAATLGDFQRKFGSDNVRFMKLDVSDETEFEEVFGKAVVTFGHIDIAVNNAGVSNESKWQLMIQVNLFGVIKGTKLAEQHMRRDKGGKGGKIVNISSSAGLIDLCSIPAYCATKHGVRSFTISQAGQYDVEAQGIEYGILCPRFVDTNMVRQLDETCAFYFDRYNPVQADVMSVTRVVEAFMHLVQLDKMNGAILRVSKDAMTFHKMKLVDMGPDFSSDVCQTTR